MYLQTARAVSEDRPASNWMDTKATEAWPNTWPQSSARELLALYTSMPSWHAQRKCDLYKTGFVNEEAIPTSYCTYATYNKRCHLSSKTFSSSVAFPVLRYIDTYRINYLSSTYQSVDVPTIKVFPASLSWCSSDLNNSTNFRLYRNRHQRCVVA
jgi:hypothetical protein